MMLHEPLSLVSHTKYGLCFNSNIDKKIFTTSTLKFEVDRLNSYAYTGFHQPDELPLDIEREKNCVFKKSDSLISELYYLNRDFYTFIEKKDELGDEDYRMIEALEESNSNIRKEVDFINADLEITDLEGLNSLVESSSQYLAINHNFYNKLIVFLNANYTNWHTILFGG